MRSTDLLYIVILVVTIGLIIFGALIPDLMFLLWVGIVLTIVFAIVWIVQRNRGRNTGTSGDPSPYT